MGAEHLAAQEAVVGPGDAGMRALTARQRFVARLGLFVCGLAAASSLLAWLMHASADHPKPLDLVMPPVSAAINLAAVAAILFAPRRTRRWILLAMLSMAVMMASASAFYIHAALQPGAGRLVDMLPPIPALLIGTIMINLLFFRPQTALRSSIVIWVIGALPVLVYLAIHPDERQSARGLELIMLLGPMTLLMAILIPLQRERDRKLQELQRAELRARNRAMRDPLTDLFNRRAFEDRLAGVIAQGSQPQQLILMDIDRFKSINDGHGHPIGDAVLCEVARRCGATLERGATFARWGGEEFAAVCRLDASAPTTAAEAMRGAIAASPIEPVGTVTASFGITRIHSDDSLESAFKRADDALYRAKETGRNRVEVG